MGHIYIYIFMLLSHRYTCSYLIVMADFTFFQPTLDPVLNTVVLQAHR